MSVQGDPVTITAAGEYGATTVSVTTDGGCLRIAFGRNGLGEVKVWHGAVILSPEAIEELKKQIEDLGI